MVGIRLKARESRAPPHGNMIVPPLGYRSGTLIMFLRTLELSVLTAINATAVM